MAWKCASKALIRPGLLLSSVFLFSIFHLLIFLTPTLAKVTGECVNCHTMHNSQGGTAMVFGTADVTKPLGALVKSSCVGCHSDPSSPVKEIGSSRVPVVFITGAEPTDYLAGGNFWWVADSGGNDDTKGHNVLGISSKDSLPQAPGSTFSTTSKCSAGGCHGSLAITNTAVTELGSGCEGCHLRVRHHAEDKNDSVTGGYRVTTETQGWYRFLVAHSGNNVKPFGVHGVEDSDWQRLTLANANKHNEYLGKVVDHKAENNLSGSGTGSITAYCCGCHGDFHIQQNSAGAWIRHPSDAVLPDRTPDSEYEAYTVYDPSAPVARQSLTSVSSSVTKGSDMVMCLSCHRPHGSPYKDILRWDYDGMIAGTTGTTARTGCFICHTSKDGV